MTDRTTAEKYYRKSALITKIIKYIVILLFIVFLISCILIFRRDITVQNIQLLAKYFSLEGSSSNRAEEFSVSCTDDSIPIMLRNNLGVIDNNNISLYDLSGQKLFSFNYAYSAPAVVHDDHSIIVYDIKGNELSLFNSFSKLKSLKFDGGISRVSVNNDTFAVISSEDTYKSVLSVYEHSNKENDYVEIFKLSTSSVFLTTVALSDTSRYVLTTSAESQNGNYSSSVMIYDTLSTSVTPLHSKSISGELPIQAGFADDSNSLYVITDSGIFFYDFNLNETSYHKFNQSKIDNYYVGKEVIVLSERNNLSGNSMLLTALSKKGDVVFKENIQDEISDFCFGTDCFFALGKNNVFKFTLDKDSNIISSKFPLSEKYHHIISDTNNNCYVLNDTTATEILFNSKKES